MAGSEYSVDDILAEIRRKKEQGDHADSAAPFTKTEEPKQQENFFEMREKNAAVEKQPEQPPTYTKKFKDEPITTRTIQVDDTLSQYFGPTEWKNGKKPKSPKEGFGAKVNTVPAHEVKKESAEPVEKPLEPEKKDPEQKTEKVENFVPKDMVKHFETRSIERPLNGFSRSAAVSDEKVKPVSEEKAALEPQLASEEVNGFMSSKEQSGESNLTNSQNHDLYREFAEKRRDKVEEFMRHVAEPTDQEIHVPEVPEPDPVKNHFSDKENSEIAKEIVKDMHEPENAEPDDYESPDQAEAVGKNLSVQLLGLKIRASILFILFLLSLVLCLSPMLGYSLPEFMAFSKSDIVFPIINLSLVCIAALVNHVAVGGGLLSLIRFRAGNDSFAACSVIGAAALGINFVIDPSTMSAGGENLFFPITILNLFFNAVGKIFSASRICKNFDILTSEGERSSLLPVRNKELARELTGQRDETPRFCTSAKADFFSHFLELSYRDDATESIARIVSPIVFLCSILVGAVAFLLTVSVSEAIVGFAAILCVATPFASTIAGALPVFRSCRALNEQGSIMAGGYTAETFAETDSVLLDIEQLFPEGSIILHGIKTFSQGRIDEAILDAASVICNTKNTLSSIFINVVQGDRKLLKPIDTIIYEDGMGLSAWVGGKRVLIGNRELMINHGVDIPSHDYENKYVGAGKDILYLANSGELTAMFVLSYHADKEVYRSLGIMANRGVKLVINCSDPNITVEKLSELFAYPETQMNLLSSKYQQKCAELTEKREQAPAAAVYNGELSTLSDLLNCCGIIRQSSFMASLIEMIGIVLSFILVTIFLFTGNIASLSMPILLAFQMFWLLAVTAVILVRRKI